MKINTRYPKKCHSGTHILGITNRCINKCKSNTIEGSSAWHFKPNQLHMYGKAMEREEHLFPPLSKTNIVINCSINNYPYTDRSVYLSFLIKEVPLTVYRDHYRKP